MGARGQYGKSKGNGEAVLEGNRGAAKRDEKNDMEECVKSRFLLEGGATLRRHICFRIRVFCFFKNFLADNW
jgi:hypothetical protein